MDKATPAAFKEMKRVMKYVIDTKGYGLKISPELNDASMDTWKLIMYTDSDWASNKEDRKSTLVL
jgi:hypothetical protein